MFGLAIRPRCGLNEKLYRCHGGCDPTCEEPEKQCIGCEMGCFCRPGFVRNEYDECIKPNHCDQNDKGSGKYCIIFMVFRILSKINLLWVYINILD